MNARRTLRTALTTATAVAIFTAAGLAAPALADDLAVWTYLRPGERAGFEEVVTAYNAKKGAAGPHVTMRAIPFDGFGDKIAGAIPRGKGPDMFLYPQDRLGGWVEAGNIVAPIDSFVDAGVKSRFIPATLQAMTYRGALYGLPHGYKLIMLVYNKKLVKEPPKTTAELAALAKKLTNRSAGTYGLVYDYANYYYHAALQNGFGGKVFDQFVHPVLNSSENVKAMELLLQWREDFLPDPDLSEGIIASMFNEGKAAMILEGPWLYGEIAKTIDFGVAPLPAISEAKNEPMRPWMTVEGMYIAAPSKQKEAAYEFMKYASDVEAEKVIALEGSQMPANQKTYLDPALASDARVNAFFKQVRVAVAMPNVPEMTVMWPSATTAIGAIVRGAATPEAALARAQAAVEKGVASLHGPARPPQPLQ